MHNPPVPEYNWLPEEWLTTKPDLKNDPHNSNTAPTFSGHTPLNGAYLLRDRLEDVNDRFTNKVPHVQAGRSVEPAPNVDTGGVITMVPHPRSDFRHIDPGVFTPGEKGHIQAAINSTRKLKVDKIAEKDREVSTVVQSALPELERVEEMLGASPKGMQRLKVVFENVLVELTVLLGEMSAALLDNKKAAYNAARAKYIELIDDLDNREPKEGDIKAGERGYGRILQWVHVEPLIHNGVIKGAKIVAKWNPHISSSGIPIPH